MFKESLKTAIPKNTLRAAVKVVRKKIMEKVEYFYLWTRY